MWTVDPTCSSAALGLDDWRFGQVESPLGPVTGVVLVPWQYTGQTFGETFSAEISISLARLDTKHRGLDRRLRSHWMLAAAGTPHLHVRLACPQPSGDAGWSLAGMMTLGTVTDAVRVSARVTVLGVDTARAVADLRADRRRFGMTRYRHQIGWQLRLHAACDLHRTST